MSCPRHLQHFKLQPINKYHNAVRILLFTGGRRGMTFLCSFPLPGSLMGSDNPLSGCVGGGSWRQSDEREVSHSISLVLQLSKNKHVSHRGSLAVPQLLSAVPLPGVSVSAALQQLIHCAASEASESPGTGLWDGFAWQGAQRSRGAVIRPHCWNFRDQCTRSKQLLWVPSCEAEIWPHPKSTPAAMNGRVGLIHHTWHR